MADERFFAGEIRYNALISCSSYFFTIPKVGFFVEEWLRKKYIDPKEIEEKIVSLKQEKKKIATLNGSFDLLHAGHLYMLYEASKQADCLIVALNSDASIQGYKGKDRPIVKLEDRLKMMAAIEFVDFVTFFDELDPRALLEKIAPDVHVNGIEYGDDCIEKEVVVRLGGKIHLVDRIASLSTTAIIHKIQKVFA